MANKPNITIKDIAKNLGDMFGLEYVSAESESELIICLDNFYNASKKPKILEV